MGKSDSVYDVEPWHEAAIKRALVKMPFTHQDQQTALCHHADAYKFFFERYAALPRREQYVYLKGEAFKERLSAYAEQEEEIVKNTGAGTGSSYILQYAEFWKDMLSMSAYFTRLVKERAMRLLKTYLRCAKTKDVFGMACTGRALMELGISSANTQSEVISGLGAVFDRLRQYDDPLSVIIQVVNFSPIERAIVKGVWGTRIYTGTLGDGNKKNGKEDTSIWEGFEIPDDSISARNIMGDIRERAKRMDDGHGIFDYRVYEILCDVVHPAALGYQLLVNDTTEDQGECTVTLTKEKDNAELSDIVVAAAAWGACHGIGLVVEGAEEFEKIEPTIKSWANSHIENQKSIMNSCPGKLLH